MYHGVAGSSPVTASKRSDALFTKNFFDSRERPALGPVVELAYTASSNLAAYGIGGSSPSGATNHFARVVELADTTV